MKKLTKPLFLFLILFIGQISNELCAQTTFSNTQYADALQKSMFFYQAQQSGPLPAFNQVNWRANSALNDGSDVGKDLTGGWYDAGDHVKFGFPMAYTATILGWGALDFKDGYVKSGQYTSIKNNLRFVYDYFIKCHTAPNELYGQVGNGGTDHSFWGAPEIMQMARPAYKIDATRPGTELAMETASALAIGSIIFKTEDPAYSATLLNHAKQLYTFGDTYRGKYSDAITDAGNFYRSFSGYQDELIWGALWLYRATNDITYLNKAEAEYDLSGNEGQTSYKPYKYGLAWDDKIYACYPLLAKFTGKPKYYADIERHLDFWTDGFNGERVTYTPGGLAWLVQWGSLRHTSNTAFLALTYGDLPNANTTKTNKYKTFAKRQIDYALGANPSNRSYVCGFGNNPPKNPHHRGAHGTWTNNLQGPPDENRHVLYGALVGGPGTNDDYADDRGDFIKNEVATDYNAGFSGALARLISDGNAVTPAPIPNEPIGEEYVATIKSNSTGTNYFEPAVVINNHTAWPARMPANLSFRYFIDISEGIASGYSISDYSVQLGGYAPNATLTPGFQLWSGSVYYVEVVYNNVSIFPGGQSESKRECQFRIYGPASAFNNANDFSYTGITNTQTQTQYVPIYENGILKYGNEPTRGVVTNYTITASAGANGTISPTGTVSVASGSNRTFTFTPNTGYEVNVVTVNGTTVPTATSYTFTNVTSNKTINVTFKPVITTNYTITASAGTNGTISPTGTVSVVSGSNRTFTFTPNAGYEVNVVTVNGSAVPTANSYTFTNVTANATINVTFKIITTTNYVISASSGANGTISPSGSVTVASGSNRTFNFIPNAGYQVNVVTVNGTTVPTASSYTFTNVTANATINVTFKTVPTGSGCLLTTFGVPRSTALPSKNSTFTNVYVLGTGGPDLATVTRATFNWDLQNNGLYDFSFNFNTSPWYKGFVNTTTKNLNTSSPSVTIGGSGITNFDSNQYYVNLIGNDVVLVEKTGTHAVYLSNSSTPPAGCSNARVANYEISTYPNPSLDVVTIEIPKLKGKKEIYLSDMSGLILAKQTVDENEEELKMDVKNLKPGVYVLTMEVRGSIITKKIIKQ